MFTKLAKSGLAKSGLAGFWPAWRGRVPHGLRAVEPCRYHCNDNRPGFRSPAVAGKRRAATPVLACHWLVRDGRLECCWHVVIDGARTDGRDAEHPLPDRACGRSPIPSRRLALAR